MAVTTNNQVRLTIRYEDYSTQNYAFDNVPDEQIAGVATRAQAANAEWVTNLMDRTFAKDGDQTESTYTPSVGIKSTGISAVRITSTEEEVIYGG